MADKIVVMHDGIVEQVGAPLDLYDRPANLFVAGFIGSPAMNFVRGRLQGGSFVSEGGLQLPVGAAPAGAEGRPAVYGIRPEHFVPAGEGHALSGRVQVVEPLGSDTLIHFVLGPSTLTARVAPEMRPNPGEDLHIGVDPSRIHLFDAATERALA